MPNFAESYGQAHSSGSKKHRSTSRMRPNCYQNNRNLRLWLLSAHFIIIISTITAALLAEVGNSE